METESCLWAGAPMSVEFLAAIIDNVAHPIFVKDRAFRYVLLNGALCEMVGYSRDAMLGKTDYEFFSEEEADFFRKKDNEMFTTEARVTIEEETMTDAAGRRHVLSTTKVPLRAHSGEVTHLVGIIHDITRLKETEEALRLANEGLERRVEERTRALSAAQDQLVRKERLAVMGKLAGGLAHQIRNPLGAITNAAYVLDRLVKKDPDSDAARALAILQEEAWRANRIITDMLDYARVRAAMPRPTDLAELLEEALQGQNPGSHVRVARELQAGLPHACIDATQARGALGNLIRNALEAMAGGGTLTLSAQQEGPDVVLAITDTGPGIAADVRERLFEPLITTKPTGLGLGLTTARTLIENQAGSLSLEDAPGGGTRAVVRLPVIAGDRDDV